MAELMATEMNSILTGLISRLKGEGFTVDKSVPPSSLLAIFLSRLISALKGFLLCFSMKRTTSSLTFVGRRARFRNRRFITLGKNVTIGEGAFLDGLSVEGLRLGDNVSLGPYTRIECTGSLRRLGKGCVIGDRSGIGAFSFIGAAGGVTIGSDVIMGQMVSFHSENHNFSDTSTPIRLQGVSSKGIQIGDDCWIGAKVTFLDGARVGTGVVIGAGSVVKGEIPSYAVAAGIPARVIRFRNENDRQES